MIKNNFILLGRHKMDCPICGSDDIEILNSKQKSSKKKLMEEYLLR
jgi:hypothetical protein